VQAETKDIALDLHHTLRQKHGLTSWLDVKMPDRSEHAMEEGVRNSNKVLVIVSEKYYSRPFCVKELRLAQQYGKKVVVAIPRDLKPRIGELLEQCPRDLNSIGSRRGIDFKTVDRCDPEYFALAVKKLIDPNAARRLARPAAIAPSPLFEDEVTVTTDHKRQLVNNRNEDNLDAAL
jgi:hypothetical protein